MTVYKKKIIHLIKTASFESDGRLKKWVTHLSNNKFESVVFLVEDRNEEFADFFNGNKIFRKKLVLRKLFRQRKGYLFKVIEYLIKTFKIINSEKFDLLIFHDVQQYLNIFFLLLLNKRRNFKIIWDLHELPHTVLLNNYLGKNFIRYIINNTDIVIYTNSERRDYIRNKITSIKERKYFILNNFPDRSFINKGRFFLEIPVFNNNHPYILWLGAGIENRNFGFFLEAYLSFKKSFNLVVLGKISPVFDNIIRKLENENVIFHKFVPQEAIINFIDKSFLSVVLYNNDSINNLLCEPNRLYQLISRKVPIVVGNNPPMANLVNKLDVGYVLEDDGRKPETIKTGINNVITNYEYFIRNFEKINFDEFFSWEDQFKEIIDFLEDQ